MSSLEGLSPDTAVRAQVTLLHLTGKRGAINFVFTSLAGILPYMGPKTAYAIRKPRYVIDWLESPKILSRTYGRVFPDVEAFKI